MIKKSNGTLKTTYTFATIIVGKTTVPLNTKHIKHVITTEATQPEKTKVKTDDNV